MFWHVGSKAFFAGNDIGGASPSRWRSQARRSSRFHLCFVLCNIVFVGNFMCLDILPGLAFKKMHEQVEADVDLFLGARRVGGTTGFVLPRVVRFASGARVRPCTLRPIGRTPCRSAPRSTDGTRTTSSWRRRWSFSCPCTCDHVYPRVFFVSVFLVYFFVFH